VLRLHVKDERRSVKKKAPVKLRELAFYYPNPMWSYGNWIKNLVLFFDGIALLVPNYMKRRPEEIDPAIVAGLRQHDLLEIIEPEKAVDKTATEKLALAMTDVITSGALDDLVKEQTAFAELSMSRLGAYGDEGLYKMILEELKKRGLAKDSEDHVSIPMHPKVRSLVLVFLAQILRPYGGKLKATLSPATDMGNMVRALTELVAVKTEPTVGAVVEFDLNTVTVDLGPIPVDEVLDFRNQNLTAHKRYMLSVRKFAFELSRMSEEERRVAFEIRQAELDDLANDLRTRARKAWRKPSSFALTLAGSAISVVTSPLASLLRTAAAVAGYEKPSGTDAGPYSYLFAARGRFRL
jgi:hypothetical protein